MRLAIALVVFICAGVVLLAVLRWALLPTFTVPAVVVVVGACAGAVIHVAILRRMIGVVQGAFDEITS